MFLKNLISMWAMNIIAIANLPKKSFSCPGTYICTAPDNVSSYFCFKSAEFFFFNRSLTTVIYTHAYKIYETGRTIWSLTLMSWGEQGTWSECPDWRRTSARRNRACSRRVPRGDRESKQSSDWIRFELLIVVVKLF